MRTPAGDEEVVRRLATVAAILFAITASGCMLPEYYATGGYSSTSRQRMEESTIDWSQTPEGKMRHSINSGAH
ncbi:MAG: hypothetical protein ACKVHE_28155 [Planctomycetales bacterium]